jgi:hypothetical protein
VRIDSSAETPDESLKRVWAKLEELELVRFDCSPRAASQSSR